MIECYYCGLNIPDDGVVNPDELYKTITIPPGEVTQCILQVMSFVVRFIG